MMVARSDTGTMHPENGLDVGGLEILPPRIEGLGGKAPCVVKRAGREFLVERALRKQRAQIRFEGRADM